MRYQAQPETAERPEPNSQAPCALRPATTAISANHQLEIQIQNAGRVGDPSGRSSERPILSDAEIERNVAGIGRVLSTILERNAAASSSGNGVATR